MIWLNFLVLAIIIGLIYLESSRGFGRALFDFIGGLLVVVLGPGLAGLLARWFPLLADESACHALWYILVLIGGGAATVCLGKLIYEATLISLDVLDPAVGALFGVGVGLLVSYALLAVLTLLAGDTEFARAVERTFCTQELYYFRSYHEAIEALHHIGQW
jgi:hypothetical protein